MATVWDYLLEVKQRRGAGYLILLDPDRLSGEELERRALLGAKCGADALLVGTSLMLSSKHLAFFEFLKSSVDIPVLSFPGSGSHVSPLADAVLFLSVISGRNPELLIGEQVRSAPVLKEMGMEVISTGYMLVESGRQTSVEFISNTRPMPRDKNDIAMAHALAAEYIGMKTVYLEGGSGALQPVADEMVRAVAGYVSLPIIVGGGIRDPETARRKVEAGASFVVTGKMLESDNAGLEDQIRSLSAAVHGKI
ncbi:MAG: geranylgeranylglyceryl/heptaprenylglyceryl phosphate synthase [Candidatus Latescibacteria bacterium]|nr:geranylgeranylglyceryl/heptaprenylglyceryl phosphate synthase [Candidatus Latescibacterota bacterium]